MGFVKFDYKDESFKLSAREFHNLMDDGIQFFCGILV